MTPVMGKLGRMSVPDIHKELLDLLIIEVRRRAGEAPASPARC